MAITFTQGYTGKFQTAAFAGALGLNVSLGGQTVSSAPVAAPQVNPVTPTYDPKIEANALYGKHIILSALGYARIGSAPAPIVGPYINGGKVDFIVSFGVPADPSGDRKIYKIYFDNELAWSSTGGGTLPAHGTFTAEAFDFVFKPGTLTQTVCSLESEKFPGEAIAYRPQMLLEIRNLTFQRFLDRGGKPVPYVACDIGDVTGGADPFDGIGVGEGLERIAYFWCGYDASTFVSENVIDLTPGYLIAENINIDQLCQNVCGIYRNLDYTHTDKRKIRDRGTNVTPDIIFGRDTILGGDRPIEITRTDASAEPRELELIKIDPDQDYTRVPSISKRPRDPIIVSAAVDKETVTLPTIMDAPTGQAMVTYAHYDRENARKKVTFSAMAYGYEVQPSDLVALVDIADGIDDEVFKVVETSHGANYVVQITAQATLRCRLYAPGGADAAPITTQQVVGGTATYAGFTAAAGDLVILLLGGYRSITNARNLVSVTIDGVAATIHGQVVNNLGGAGPNLAIASLVLPSALTVADSIVATYDGPNTINSMTPYILTNFTNPNPTDIDSSAVASGDPAVAIDVADGGVVFALWVGSGGTPAAVTFSGAATEDVDTAATGLGGSVRFGAAHEAGLGGQSGRSISGSSTMTAETIIAASWA